MSTDRPLAPWFDDAKFGIMVHWTPACVPAFAPRAGVVWEVPDQFRDNPYVEWYYNSLQIEGSPVRAFHDATYGRDYPYERFAEEFKRSSAAWDPAPWATLFAAAGARYVVPVTKHHDGFCLWPSAHVNPKLPPGYGSSRDLIGELGEAVRAVGLRYGLYYSGGLDWPWHYTPIRSMQTMMECVPRDPEYVDYAFNQWRELIDRYEPCTLWNDIWMPGGRERIAELFDYYLARVPDGVVNDRFHSRLGDDGLLHSLVHCDYNTPEYQPVADIRSEKWEAVRGIGHSFGYNREEGDADYQQPADLVHSLIDIVSKNGNLLLNVGPMADGTIPELQASRLRAVGSFLASYGEAIYGTRPWTRAEGTTAAGEAVRFTTKGRTLYAVVLAGPRPGELLLPGVPPVTAVHLPGHAGALAFRTEGDGVVVTLPPGLDDGPAFAIALEGAASG
ncbi:MAG: alpha-L-fucosidase [Dehalococcoidia bacterium]